MVALLLLTIYAGMTEIAGLDIWQEPIVLILNHIAIVQVHLLLIAQSLIDIPGIVMPNTILLLILLVLALHPTEIAVACNCLLIVALLCINEFLKLLVGWRLDCAALLTFAH